LIKNITFMALKNRLSHLEQIRKFGHRQDLFDSLFSVLFSSSNTSPSIFSSFIISFSSSGIKNFPLSLIALFTCITCSSCSFSFSA
jgi:hypothetical protein